MAVESEKWKMLNIDGLPLVGEANKTIHILQQAFTPESSTKLTRQMRPMDMMNQPDNKFAERVILTYIPRLTDPKGFTKSEDDDLLLYRGVLGERIMTPYLSARKGAWRGDDEFERKDSFNRFHRDQASKLKLALLPPPYRVRTIHLVQIGDYDFAKKQFPLGRGEYEHPFVFNLELNHPYVSAHFDRSFQLKLPSAWPIALADARNARNLLLKPRYQPNSGGVAIQSSVFDVFDSAHKSNETPTIVTPVEERSDLNGHFVVKHLETALFSDINLTKRLWTVLETEPKPVAATPTIKP